MKSLLLLLFLNTSFGIAAQDSLNYTLKNHILVKGEAFEVDHLGNVYVLANQGEIHKYNDSGRLTFSFYALDKGEIKSIDVSDPLKIIVFLEDQQEILTLDNTLSITGGNVLFENEIFDGRVVCAAKHELAWVYDFGNDHLYKIDRLGKAKTNGLRISSLIYARRAFYFMVEKDNEIFLADSINGILRFDNFGSFKEIIEIPLSVSFQVFNQMLFYFIGDSIQVYNLNTYQKQKSALPPLKGIKAIKILGQKLYVLNASGISIFEF